MGRVIAACARQRGLTVLLVAAAALLGARALQQAPLDALPDLSDVQVIVFTEWPGRSPELIEDQITYPISARLLGAPAVRSVRGESYFGYSAVYVIFADGTDVYWARSRVLESLSSARGALPEGVEPSLGPDATGVGWVYEYALVDRSGRQDLAELRSLQDWTLRYALQSVPGVAEVASVGGFVRQYEVQVDPNRLAALGIPIGDVIRAVRDSNEEAGGSSLELGGHEYVVRGRGYLRSLDDLRRVPLRAAAGGAPVFLEDVAEVSFGPEARRGIAELDGRGETVGGIVVMRSGENALRVIDGVKARLAELRGSLPEGVEVVPTYDRSELIRGAVGTLRRTLLEEIAIVSLVVFGFLLHFRSALIPILTIPVGVLLAFLPMERQGLTANIMSLGGIAVAIGAMVDASIIVVENVHRRLLEWERAGRGEAREAVILRAMQEVGPSLFFALLVITVSFLPIFALEGTEGRLFKPLAFTKTYAMGFAALLSVTLTPALAALLVRGRLRGEDEHPLNRRLVRAYAPVVRRVVRHPLAVVVGALLLMAATVPVFLRLGSEFMPPLDEGSILYMPTAPPGIGATEAASLLQRMDRELLAVPEVARVFGKIGRAESATDMAPLSMVETILTLRPASEWRAGAQLRRPGGRARRPPPVAGPAQPVLDADPDPHRDARDGDPQRARREGAGRRPRGDRAHRRGDRGDAPRAAGDAQRRRGAQHRRLLPRSASRPRGRGPPRPPRAGPERGGRERDRRGAPCRRWSTAAAASRSRCATPGISGRTRTRCAACWWRRRPARCPSASWRSSSSAMGPPFVRSEAGRLVGYVLVDVAGDRPIVEYVAEAKRAIAERVSLPAGVRLEWAGQFQYFERARERLRLLLPLTLAPRRRAALREHRLRRRDGHGAPRGAVLADRRGVAALGSRLPPQRGGLGGRHRPRRPRRADGGGDAALPDPRPPRAGRSRARSAAARTSRRRSSRGRRGGSGRS